MRGRSTTSTARALVTGWILALVGFLVGVFGGGFGLNLIGSASGSDAMIAWTWLPAILGAVLCGVAAGWWTPCDGATPWWRWVVVGAPIPLGGGLFIWAYFTSYEVEVPGLVGDTAVQVILAVALTLLIGMLRVRRASRRGAAD